jgi:hypothetical protein
MEIRSKKKYRIASDLCKEFGFNPIWFDKDQKFDYEFKYGMYLQVVRCQSIIGAQAYKALFYTVKMRQFYIDDEICDALVNHPDFKQQKARWFARYHR